MARRVEPALQPASAPVGEVAPAWPGSARDLVLCNTTEVNREGDGEREAINGSPSWLLAVIPTTTRDD